MKVSIPKANVLHIILEEATFQLSVTGFDPKRDLKIRTTYIPGCDFMIRRFNFTGRKKIPRSKVSIALHEAPGKALAFDANVDLEGIPLPSTGSLFVEAYRRAYFRRFPCGTAGTPRFPKNCVLEGLDAGTLVLFRVKAVDRKGRILAVADKIIPRRTNEEPANRQFLLPVDFVDLGNTIWRLDLEGDFRFFN